MVYVQKGGMIRLVSVDEAGKYLKDGFAVLKVLHPEPEGEPERKKEPAKKGTKKGKE